MYDPQTGRFLGHDPPPAGNPAGDPPAPSSASTPPDRPADETAPTPSPAAQAQPYADNPELAQPENWPPPVPLILPSPYTHGAIGYLSSYDEGAEHEKGQGIYEPRQLSGGAAHYICAVTLKGWSVPLDPQQAPTEPPQLAR